VQILFTHCTCFVSDQEIIALILLLLTGRQPDAEHVSSISAAITSSATSGRQEKATRHGYHLWMKSPAVTWCYGCRRRFADRYSKPPRDVIIRRFMNRRYEDKKTGIVKKSSKVSATYFHLNMNCVRKVTPCVNIKDLFVHDEVWPHLTGERVSILQKFGLELFPDE